MAGWSKERKVGYTVESFETRGVQMRAGTRRRRGDANGRCKWEGARLDGLTLGAGAQGPGVCTGVKGSNRAANERQGSGKERWEKGRVVTGEKQCRVEGTKD